VPTLREWYRVVKPGGTIIIEVPDLVWCVTNWLKTQDGGWDLDAIFGNQDDIGQFHKTGFTVSLLLGYLDEAGYVGRTVVVAEVWNHNQNTIHLEITVRK
jgi:predicted SAM-dependent methyltransferase